MDSILIVDDEKSLLDLLTVVLKKEGYRVKTCLAASRSFEILEKEEFDLLICDIKLPEVSGMEVLRVRAGKPSGDARDHDHGLRQPQAGGGGPQGRRHRLYPQAL